MKVFSFFTEPASYTLDLIDNVYQPMSIDYCFLKSSSKAINKFNNTGKIFLDRKSLLDCISYMLSVRDKYNILIFNSYNNVFFLFLFIINIFSKKKNFIAIESDTQLLIPDNYLKRILKYLYLSFIFRKKNIFGLAGGNYIHKELFRYYGMKEERIFLMPMMVNNKKFFFKNKKKKIFTFLFVGRIVKVKNLEALIKQFILRFDSKDAILKIVGDGELKDELFDKYNNSKIKFLGKLFDNELIQEFQEATVLVCPSYFEPWGLVVNEGLSAGLPVIARKEVGATYDLIINKNTGFVVNNDNDFGKKMLSLFNDKQLLKSYSSNATALMKNDWNYRLYVKNMGDFISKLTKL